MRTRYKFISSAQVYAQVFPQAVGGMQYEGAGLYNLKTGYQMEQPQGDEICAPMICSDIPDYRSPVDGKVISGRVQRRDDLKRHNCYEIDPPGSGTMHRGLSKKYAPTLKQRQKKREPLVLGEDRVLNNKLEAVANGARGI